MRRRQVLASLGVGLGSISSGCSGLDFNDESTPTSYRGETASTQTSLPDPFDGLARIKLVSTDSVPEQFNLRFTAEVTRPTVTREETAAIRISVENTSDSHDSWYTNDTMQLFTGFNNDADLPTAVLHYAGRSDPSYKRRPDCWVPSEPVIYGEGPGANWIRAGETESVGLRLWGHRNNPSDVCIPAGTYDFENTFEAATEEKTEFAWGLTIDVEKP